MKKKIIPIVILAIVIIGGIIIYSSTQQPAIPTKITLATHKIPLAAPFIIAKEKGFFQKNGMDVEVVYFTTGLETLHALTENKADFASSGGTPYVHLSFQRDDVKIINQVTLSNDFQIIARKDMGVNSLKDLKSKKIGFVKGTVTELVVVDALKNEGFSKEDYVMVGFNQPLALPNALLAKEIDAYSAWEPFIFNGTKAVGNDNVIVFGSEKGFYPLPYLSIVRSSYLIDENKKVIDKFNGSLLEAIDYINNNFNESVNTVATIVGMDPSVLSQIWNKYDFNLSLTQELLNDLNKQKNWLRTEDIKIDPDYRKLIDAESLKRIILRQVEL